MDNLKQNNGCSSSETEGGNGSLDTVILVKDLMVPFLNRVDRLYRGKIGPGIETGIAELDELGGIRKGEFVLIGSERGNESMHLMHKMVCNMCEKGGQGPILLLTPGFPELKVVEGLFANITGITLEDVRNKQIKPSDLPKFTKAADMLCRSDIFIDNRYDLSVSNFIDRIMAIREAIGVEFVLIDALQAVNDAPSFCPLKSFPVKLADVLGFLSTELGLSTAAIVPLAGSPLNRSARASQFGVFSPIAETADRTVIQTASDQDTSAFDVLNMRDHTAAEMR